MELGTNGAQFICLVTAQDWGTRRLVPGRLCGVGKTDRCGLLNPTVDALLVGAC